MKINSLPIVILFIGTILRLWNLGNIPSHLTPDEAALGYNAYSVLKTGRDEYGQFLPMILKSFGDYKPGLYIYLTVPSVAIFGLTEFAVRLPSALSGILVVYLIYLISTKLFGKETGIVTAFVSAATPWLIYFSRGAWEVNLSLALTLLGVYLFLRALDDPKFLVLSSISFSLTLLAYQGAKLSTGIVLLVLLVVYWKKFWSIEKREIIKSVVFGFLISLPIVFSFFTGQTGRLNIFSVFSYPRPREYIQEFLNQGEEKIGDVNYLLFHSEALNFARGIMGRYFNHFSMEFLFFEGDTSNPRHTAPYQGMLLASDAILLALGAFVFLRNKITKEKLFVVLWLILSPLPAVLSRDQVHAIRALNMSVPLIIVISFGYAKISKWSYLFVLLAFIYFLDSYFVHVPKHNSHLWEYGYKQVVETITPIQKNYKTIKVQQSFAQPYIYFLFFQKYDPAKYQENAELTVADSVSDVGYITKLDNIEFAPIDWSINRGESGTLFVADPVRIPPEDSKDETQFTLVKEIKYLNGRDTAFRIVEVK